MKASGLAIGRARSRDDDITSLEPAQVEVTTMAGHAG